MLDLASALRLPAYSLLAVIVALSASGVRAVAEESTTAGSDKLNVVFFLIDDLGWKDLGCQGSTYYRTPNIDRLAAEGMRFTDAYSACTVCSPTRAAIMSGKYPARLLLTQWLPSGRWDAERNKLQEARYATALPLEELTIAEALRKGGYRTGFFGKWHLGPLPYYSPAQQGFDVVVGGGEYGAPGDYFYPFTGKWKLPTTNQTVDLDAPVSGQEGDYLIDRISEEADRFIREHADRPFLAYISHFAVHAPLQGKPEMAARYEEVPKDKRQGNPNYAAMVESVDESVGRITNTLDELGLAERTLIVFTSDNGGFAKATDNSPLRANKGSNYEGGIRVPLIVKWPGKTKPGSVSHEPVISTDYYPTILDAVGLPRRPHQHLDGESLADVLSGGKLERDAIFWHYPHYNQHPQSFPCGVIRAGDWKLIEPYETGQLELYNLAEDPGEEHNLATAEPDRAKLLLTRLEAWRRSVDADMMRPNPQWIPD